jgi:hypothetical protein
MKIISMSAILLSMFLNLGVFAQDKKDTQIVVYKLPAHTYVNKMPWYIQVYYFSDFQPGAGVYASTRKDRENRRLNYNLYYEKIECINEKGDTVLLKTAKLKLVNIEGTVFLYDNAKGYIRIVVDAPVALGVKTFMNTERLEYVSGSIDGSVNYDRRSSTSVYDRYYKIAATYFFIDRKRSIHKASKPSILKIFARHAEKINEYMEANPVDFGSEEDLIRLVTFCNGLRNT